MKNRKKINGSKNDNWETPEYLLKWISKNIFFNLDYFDPCPLSEKISLGMKDYEDIKIGDDGISIISRKTIQKEEFEYILQFDGLKIDWKKRNFVNPPYNTKGKKDFIKKCYEEYIKGNTIVLLIPSTTETKYFHEYIAPYARIYFIKGRVSFKGFNSYGEYVTDRTGQSGSMLCVFDLKYKPFMKTLEF